MTTGIHDAQLSPAANCLLVITLSGSSTPFLVIYSPFRTVLTDPQLCFVFVAPYRSLTRFRHNARPGHESIPEQVQ